MENLSVYGTLIDERTQRKIIKRVPEQFRDSLKGYEKSRIIIDDETYPTLVKSKYNTCLVDGMVLIITSEELKAIDRYESEAYRRKMVNLESGMDSWAYLK